MNEPHRITVEQRLPEASDPNRSHRHQMHTLQRHSRRKQQVAFHSNSARDKIQNRRQPDGGEVAHTSNIDVGQGWVTQTRSNEIGSNAFRGSKRFLHQIDGVTQHTAHIFPRATQHLATTRTQRRVFDKSPWECHAQLGASITFTPIETRAISY